MKNKKIVGTLLLGTLCVAAFAAHAQASVVDLSHATQQDVAPSAALEIDQDEPSAAPRVAAPNHQNESIDQRVLRLERQIANLTEMNYASKFEKMQQDLQQLHGQIEVQNHDLSQLKEQVRNFYQDLDQRIAKVAPGESSGSAGKNSVSTENKPLDETATTTDSKVKESQAYEVAFNLLHKKDYDKAISSFQSFVKTYPSSTYTVNAHYWLGEIYYLKNKPEQANKEFQLIVTNYPDNPKVADALLKIASIAMDAGNYSQAKQSLTKVQKQFPGSTAAKIAALRLKEIKQKH